MIVIRNKKNLIILDAAKIAKKAYQEGTNLKEAAISLKILNEKQFEDWVKPDKMISPRD